jgi:hypothetical protein
VRGAFCSTEIIALEVWRYYIIAQGRVHSLRKRREDYTRKGGSQMFSLRMISLKKLALAISLVAMLGVASCGVHVGGHVGSHHGEIGAGVDK